MTARATDAAQAIASLTRRLCAVIRANSIKPSRFVPLSLTVRSNCLCSNAPAYSKTVAFAPLEPHGCETARPWGFLLRSCRVTRDIASGPQCFASLIAEPIDSLRSEERHLRPVLCPPPCPSNAESLSSSSETLSSGYETVLDRLGRGMPFEEGLEKL
jgi:hypothetical protein